MLKIEIMVREIKNAFDGLIGRLNMEERISEVARTLEN